MTEPAATWVVESAKPRWLDARIVAVVDASAAKPWVGSISVMSAAHRLDDAPAARVGAERDRDRAGGDHPELGRGADRLQAGRDEREGDDAHRLLRVVRAVGERDQRGGEDLADLEAVAFALARELERELRGEERDQARGHRREHRRDQDLRDENAAVDRAEPEPDDRRADEPAEQRVARRGGKPEAAR